MQPRSFLSPPILALPPPLDARTLSVALARVPRSAARAVSLTTAVVRAPVVVRLVRRIVRAVVTTVVAAVRFALPRAQQVIAVSGARPPPSGTAN